MVVERAPLRHDLRHGDATAPPEQRGSATVSGLAAAFDRLVDTLEAHGSTIRSYLNAGVDPGRVDAALRAAGVLPHPQLIELYSWRDGTDQAGIRSVTDCGPQLVPATAFPPLLTAQDGWDDSLSMWRCRVTEPGFTGPGPGAWPLAWYPLFSGPSEVALDLDTGEVWLYDYPWGGANVWLAGSLPDLAGRIVEGLESRTIQLDSHGCFTGTDW